MQINRITMAENTLKEKIRKNKTKSCVETVFFKVELD